MTVGTPSNLAPYYNIETLENVVDTWADTYGLDIEHSIDYFKKNDKHKAHMKKAINGIKNVNKKLTMRQRLRKKLEEKKKNTSS